MSDSFEDLKPRVRPEIRDLAKRGNVTSAEVAELCCNSWEWEALVPALSDEAFVLQMQRALDNCFTTRERPFVTYNAAVEGLYAPELLRRFQAASREARAFAETIDNVRAALGQEATHYLIIADDVKELVEAVELDDSEEAKKFYHPGNTVRGPSHAIAALRRLRGDENGTPQGFINNCALANFDEEKNCQMCAGQCPDRSRFETP
jgi:hypothetical protein